MSPPNQTITTTLKHEQNSLKDEIMILEALQQSMRILQSKQSLCRAYQKNLIDIGGSRFDILTIVNDDKCSSKNNFISSWISYAVQSIDDTLPILPKIEKNDYGNALHNISLEGLPLPEPSKIKDMLSQYQSKIDETTAKLNKLEQPLKKNPLRRLITSLIRLFDKSYTDPVERQNTHDKAKTTEELAVLTEYSTRLKSIDNQLETISILEAGNKELEYEFFTNHNLQVNPIAFQKNDIRQETKSALKAVEEQLKQRNITNVRQELSNKRGKLDKINQKLQESEHTSSKEHSATTQATMKEGLNALKEGIEPTTEDTLSESSSIAPR